MKGVTVTTTDPETGDTQTCELPPHGYVITCGEFVEVVDEPRYGNGTVVLTLKPVR